MRFHGHQQAMLLNLKLSLALLTISQVAEKDARITAKRLKRANKLSLVLDLDQTLVHATQDPAVESLFPTGSITDS